MQDKNLPAHLFLKKIEGVQYILSTAKNNIFLIIKHPPSEPVEVLKQNSFLHSDQVLMRGGNW